MASGNPWIVRVKGHPGSSDQEVADEPNWDGVHQHRIGYLNSSNRVPGLTHDGDHHAAIEKAEELRKELKVDISTGKLVNFRDVIEHQTVSHTYLWPLHIF